MVSMRDFVKRVNDLVRKRVYRNREVMEFLLLFLLIYTMLDAVILAWFFASPLLVQGESRLALGLGMLAYNVGYLTTNCHQMPERSIVIEGVEMPFCARDTAIYVGCLVGALLPFYVKMPKFAKKLLFAAILMVPLAADGVSQTILTMRESSNALRIVTGLLFGYGLVYYFAVRIVENSASIDILNEVLKVLRICVIVIILLLSAGYAYGGGFISKNQAIGRSGLNPTFVTFASKRALHMIHYDPYFDTYKDPILSAIYSYGPQPTGVWVVYEGPTPHEGKYVFFSGSGGKIRMVPDQ